MNYIVFDLEFNMFFKFNEGDSANPNLKNEIIQIGAVKLNEKLETIGKFDLLIRPVIYKRMNPYVKRKININTRRVIQGTPFIKAIESFKAWVGNEYVLCSWGHDDILALRENCLFFEFDSLFFNKFINIQQIYMNLKSLSKQPKLESVVEGLEIAMNSPFHDAFSDAFYTAEIFRKVFDFSDDVIINWEKVQEENALKIEELKMQIDKVTICCPGCGELVPKNGEVTKRKKYFAYGHCVKCDLHIRHISRIAHDHGEYSIISNNNIYNTDEVTD
ncbi:Exonuclease family protein [Candidatus Desulfosporosinus infrequens]|uniref:Exonuclease family protein n=1 Tax=Candidatus Desulfosporosinus infrequens TaxID=2043169 RepID=A0A2U3KGU3_9FIRM|nr:Exonuclease family protein [Candidatus Desulfosporosinus infrequens]